MSTLAPRLDAHTHLLLTGPPHYPLPMRSVDALLDQQQAHGITRSIVYSPMEVQRAFRASEDPLGYAGRYNNFISEIQARHGDQIIGAGIVYPFAGEASAREAERVVRELGLHAVMVNPYMRGAWLDQDERAEPMLAAVEQLGVPLILHPEEDLEREAAAALGRELRYAEGLVLWRTFATSLVLYGFACGPLLDRFPRLRLVFAHGGGSFFPSAARVELLFEELLPGEDPIVQGQWHGEPIARNPIDWLRAHEVYFDCAWFSGEALLGAVRQFGSDRFLFGTDGSAHGRSIDFYAQRFDALPLPEADLQAMRFDNAARLFAAR